MEWDTRQKADEDSTRRSEHSKEFSLSKIWGAQDSEEGRTEHRMVTSIGLQHSRHQSFKKPMLFPVFFPSRRTATVVTEPQLPIEDPPESAASVPESHPPRGASPHRKAHSLHKRSSQPTDLLAVVHTDPGEVLETVAELPGRRVTTTAATNHEEDPQGLFECHPQEFSYEESVRAGRGGDIKLDASLDFGDKCQICRPCLAYCNACNRETRTVVRRDLSTFQSWLDSVSCCLCQDSKCGPAVHFCSHCGGVLSRA